MLYNGKLYDLFCNPLESYYNEDNPRPKYYFGDKLAGWSTACWRGYRAIWAIEDKKLYLLDIIPCFCLSDSAIITDDVLKQLKKYLPEHVLSKLNKLSGKKYERRRFSYEFQGILTDREYRDYRFLISSCSNEEFTKADLEKFFPDKFADGKVFADWFTGTLSIPQGEIIEYVHMGYNSVYEKEILIEIHNGKVDTIMIIENKPRNIPDNFVNIYGILIDFSIPDKFHYKSDFLEKDTLSFSSEDDSLFIEAHLSPGRKNSAERKEFLRAKADSIITYNTLFRKAEKQEFKLRQMDGIYLETYKDSVYHCIVIITNIHSELYLYYRENNEEKKAKKKMYNIRNSIILNEFPIIGFFGY